VALLCPMALWRNYSLREKLRHLIARRWIPSDEETLDAARRTLLADYFGPPEDLGDVLFDLMYEHWQKPHKLDQLTEHDKRRADALRVYTVSTRNRLCRIVSSPPLNLHLLRRSPLLCMLVAPMVVKVPVSSLRFFLEIDVDFAFNEIRRSDHPHANDLISLLYETLFLQQKIAITLSQLLQHVWETASQKTDVIFLAAEANIIMAADLLFAYEKASVEKTVALVGHTLSLSLEGKKKHKQRFEALRKALEPWAGKTYYADMLLSFVSSEALQELNSYRTGLLHSHGIAELQPHNYVRQGADNAVLMRLFTVLHEQHAKNTASLLAALALLTDDLVRRQPPEFIPQAILSPDPRLVEAVRQFIATSPDADPTSGAGAG